MDDRTFDHLSRRMGELTRPALPRRGVLRLFGGAALAGALGLAGDPDRAEAARKKKNRDRDRDKENRCKKAGKKCDKRRCRKRGRRCCCDDIKCTKGRCEGKGGRCGTDVSAGGQWGGFGSGDGKFRTPWGVATDRDGNVYVTDSGNSRVQVFSGGGSFIRKWGVQGSGQEQFQEPRGIGVNQESSNNNGTRVFVADPRQNSSSRRLRKFRTNGTYLSSLGRDGLSNPRGIAIDDDNNVWVVDGSSRGKIFLFDRNGSFRTSWEPSGSGELSSPEGIAVYEDRDGSISVYVTDTGRDRVMQYEFTGTSSSGLRFLRSAGSRGGGDRGFNGPTGLAADTCGNLWVADRFNNRIQQLDKNLTFRSHFTAGFNRPADTAVSPDGKWLYVTDSENDRMQRFRLNDN